MKSCGFKSDAAEAYKKLKAEALQAAMPPADQPAFITFTEAEYARLQKENHIF